MQDMQRSVKAIAAQGKTPHRAQFAACSLLCPALCRGRGHCKAAERATADIVPFGYCLPCCRGECGAGCIAGQAWAAVRRTWDGAGIALAPYAPSSKITSAACDASRLSDAQPSSIRWKSLVCSLRYISLLTQIRGLYLYVFGVLHLEWHIPCSGVISACCMMPGHMRWPSVSAKQKCD